MLRKKADKQEPKDKYLPYAISNSGEIFRTETIYGSKEECFAWFDALEKQGFAIKFVMIDCHYTDHSKDLITYKKEWVEKERLHCDGFSLK